MPIDTETFDRGDPEGSIESEILDLLYENPETAYNSREIASEVMDGGLSARYDDGPGDVSSLAEEFFDIAAVVSILDRLVDDHNIDRRVVEAGHAGRSYYRAPSAVVEEAA